MATQYDVLIIGGGPGGYVTAIRAAQLGFKTALVEREHLGGICLNWGCIPTKALLRSAEIFHYATHASNYGLKLEGTMSFNIADVIKRSRGVSGQLNGGVGFLLKKNKVDVIWGEAKITKPGEVSVGKSTKPAVEPQHPVPKGVLGEGTYQAKHIIIATGARPRALPGIEPDKKLIWTYFEAMVPDVMPKSLIVMGSGAIGIEFASFYRTMGADVTVVEVMPQILPVEDAEIAALARKRFEKAGIKIMSSTKVTKVEKKANSVVCTLEDEKGNKSTLEAERLISAVGVVGNIENIGLEKLGVKTDRGCVVTDGLGRTNIPGIYAIGDVAGPPMLAHKAVHEGHVAAEAAAGEKSYFDAKQIPSVAYTDPEVAWAGLTEEQCKAKGIAYEKGLFPWAASGRAIANGRDEGFTKLIFDANTHRIIGGGIVGTHAGDLIGEVCLAIEMGADAVDIGKTIHPHPTLGESVGLAAEAAHGHCTDLSPVKKKTA